jgi:hypothetical protein
MSDAERASLIPEERPYAFAWKMLPIVGASFVGSGVAYIRGYRAGAGVGPLELATELPASTGAAAGIGGLGLLMLLLWLLIHVWS